MKSTAEAPHGPAGAHPAKAPDVRLHGDDLAQGHWHVRNSCGLAIHWIITCIVISAYIYIYRVTTYDYIYIYIHILSIYIYNIRVCVCGLCGIVGHCGALWSPCRPRSASFLVAVFATRLWFGDVRIKKHDSRDKKGIRNGEMSMVTLWWWLLHSHDFSMAHRNRWFTY